MGFNTINKISQQYNIDVKQNKVPRAKWYRNNRRTKSSIIKTTNIYELKW